MPTEKKVTILARHRVEYSTRTHGLPQNLPAIHFTKTDSGCQKYTSTVTYCVPSK
ncbi:hypothetical protein RDI58_026661 [Solanum bulbocastanum]|uniref:Uncharacterized protein n=1 Tax=Solanum bulbocastanum TaxID=147425 RepID=A0AAN8Y131_SOLBU